MDHTFLVSFLTTHWTRIRKISLGFTAREKVEYQELWEIFFRPSPNLEVFTFSFFVNSRKLFSDSSPLLSRLMIMKMSFGPSSALSNLRFLKLTMCYIGMDIMSTLSHMKSLESLEIALPFTTFRITPSDIVPAQWSTITLPALRFFKLSINLARLPWILYQMIPIRKHITHLAVVHEGQTIDQFNSHFHLEDLERCLLIHLRAVLEGHDMIYLNLSDFYLWISTGSGSKDDNLY